MVLGVGLHASLSFIPDAWAIEDRMASLSGPYDEFFCYVHGFRMPLFFLLSGFFTALLWRRRGLRGLLAHRAVRVGLPLLIGLFTVIPATEWSARTARALARSSAPLSVAQVGPPAILEAATPANSPAADTGLPFRIPRHLHHLWFLWYLVLFASGFAVLLAGGRALRRTWSGPLPPWLLPAALAVLPACTLAAQLLMRARIFGPDTSARFVPAPHVLAYYATFFAAGALSYGRTDREGVPLLTVLSRRWKLSLAVSTFALFPLGLLLTFVAGPGAWPAAAAVQALFTWVTVLGMIGLFERVLRRGQFAVRLLSDAAYWVYLVHLPLVYLMQGAVAGWAAPTAVKFWSICAAVLALSLLTYRHAVRYTAVGRLLNGSRTRAGDRVLRAALREGDPA
jgi:peptidoglycan/LPS O-acetylase OafA/YrhL